MRLWGIFVGVLLIAGAGDVRGEEAVFQTGVYDGDTASLVLVRHGCGPGMHRVNGRCVTDPGRAGLRWSSRTGFGPKCRYEKGPKGTVRTCR